MSGIQRQGSETTVRLPCRSRLPIRSLQNGAAPFSDIHEASRSVSHDQPRVDGQHLAPPCEPVHSKTRESRSHFVVPRGEQSKILHPSHVPLTTTIPTSPFFHLRARLVGSKTREGGASACLACLARLLLWWLLL